MNNKEFKKVRNKLNKTQYQMAVLLGTSLKTIQSYEQGWRNIPAHVERHMLFLLSRVEEIQKGRKACWDIKKCPPEIKEHCPAWEFKLGNLCWFVSGNVCCGYIYRNWTEKMKLCRSCEVFKPFL